MNTVKVSVETREEFNLRAKSAFQGTYEGSHITFASVDLLWQTLTPKRWELLKALTGQGAMSIREASRLVSRDVKTVHGDINALLDSGVLDRTTDGKVIVPYDAIHVDFMLP